MDNDLDFDLAAAIWECGDDIPLDLAARLMERGYDVEALRNEHMN